MSDERRAEVGLTRDTWQLQVVSDSEHPATLGNEISSERGNKFDFPALMKLARTKVVRFAKVMTCLNIGCPLGMGIWEGVPMRDIVWLTQPKENLRRVFYHGYHNHDEKQMFRSSLPIGRVLEDTNELPPVILCFKLNGEWLSPERGGPVRVVVPEAYGFKSVKWLTHLVLSNISHANDTYADQNNDVDSDLKTFCATLSLPEKMSQHQPIPITGWAQSGVSGLAKVQIWIQDKSSPWPSEDQYFRDAPWRDAEILKLPGDWNTEIRDAHQLRNSHSFSAQLEPRHWPLRLAKSHWACLHPGLPAGEYIVRCRTIDRNGAAQPMPRPFRKSGHAAIESRRLVVE
ncbi:MAG: molybdopterin-dependent oxidoreductase [Fuerstiella sp.]